MKYAIVKTRDCKSSYALTKSLIDETKVMYRSILFPYTDDVILGRENECNIYFSDTVIVMLDYLSESAFNEFMKKHDYSEYRISSGIKHEDLFCRTGLNEGYIFPLDSYIGLKNPIEVRSASRNISAFSEIAERILKEYNGKVIGSYAGGISFDVDQEHLSEVLERFKQAKQAIYG